MALTESWEACLTDLRSKLPDVSSETFFSLIKYFGSLIFFSGDQLGPFKSSYTNFSSSLRPSKNLRQLSGKELGSVM